MSDNPSALVWLDSLRDIVGRLHQRISGINREGDPLGESLRRAYVVRELEKLCVLFKNIPHFETRTGA